MFNGYLHRKIVKKKRDISDEILRSAKTLEIQSKIREKLLKKYKIRLARRIVDLATDPVPIVIKSRSKSPVFFGESVMRLRPRDSKARIHDALIQNTWLDINPIYVPKCDFRPRHKLKEINSHMKFTPKDRYERLMEKWENDKDIIYTWEANKNAFPNKIKKVYYKTIESIALNVSPESCSKDSSKVFLGQVSEESFDEKSINEDREKLGIIAQNALEKCHLRPKKEYQYMSIKKTRNYS